MSFQGLQNLGHIGPAAERLIKTRQLHQERVFVGIVLDRLFQQAFSVGGSPGASEPWSTAMLPSVASHAAMRREP